jgi:hypothetical protein
MDIKLILADGIIIGLFLLVACLMVVMYLNVFYFIFLRVPTLSAGNKVVEKILQNIDFGSRKKFYDLGSGNGRLISLVADCYPELECIGIEYNITAYCHAKIRNIFSKNKVSYRRENFFKINLGDADVIYAYLYPPVMERLESKFAKELRRGTVVILNSFPFKTKEPKTILRGKTGALDTLYIYEY